MEWDECYLANGPLMGWHVMGSNKSDIILLSLTKGGGVVFENDPLADKIQGVYTYKKLKENKYLNEEPCFIGKTC